jgi:hypothetical protein
MAKALIKVQTAASMNATTKRSIFTRPQTNKRATGKTARKVMARARNTFQTAIYMLASSKLVTLMAKASNTLRTVASMKVNGKTTSTMA